MRKSITPSRLTSRTPVLARQRRGAEGWEGSGLARQPPDLDLLGAEGSAQAVGAGAFRPPPPCCSACTSGSAPRTPCCAVRTATNSSRPRGPAALYDVDEVLQHSLLGRLGEGSVRRLADLAHRDRSAYRRPESGVLEGEPAQQGLVSRHFTLPLRPIHDRPASRGRRRTAPVDHARGQAPTAPGGCAERRALTARARASKGVPGARLRWRREWPVRSPRRARGRAVPPCRGHWRRSPRSTVRALRRGRPCRTGGR